jgi:hypothetical protein
MKIFNLPITALAAVMMTGCGFGAANDEPVTVAPAAAAAPVTSTPATTVTTKTVDAEAPLAVAAKPDDTIQRTGAHINASAFLNALVESGCQIDKAEYKEVKRGGAIKVVCTKTIDALKVELDDL